MLNGIGQYVLVFALVVCVGSKLSMELWVFVYGSRGTCVIVVVGGLCLSGDDLVLWDGFG